MESHDENEITSEETAEEIQVPDIELDADKTSIELNNGDMIDIEVEDLDYSDLEELDN